MSFERTKERLIDEFVQAQAAIRAEFNMAPPKKKDDDSTSSRPAGPGKLTSAS
jgi:hypothetical protein